MKRKYGIMTNGWNSPAFIIIIIVILDRIQLLQALKTSILIISKNSILKQVKDVKNSSHFNIIRPDSIKSRN
jgi:hypothetical protein